jgi:hypothetical protein
VVVLELQCAVIVYVVVDAGEILREPGVATPPMPLSISTESAFVTKPQDKLVELPAVMTVADVVKDAMCGVPVQPDGALVAVAGGGEPGTLIETSTVCPNGVPEPLRIRQRPEWPPGADGAFIGTEMSAVAPGVVGGTATIVLVDIASPLTKTN